MEQKPIYFQPHDADASADSAFATAFKLEAPSITANDILGIPFNFIDYQETLSLIDYWRASEQRHYITETNPHVVMVCREDQTLAKALKNASLVLPDGIGITLGAKLLNYDFKERVTGPTLMLKVCEFGLDRGYRHFFYGGEPGIEELLAKKLSEKFPGLIVAGTHSPPFRELSESEDRQTVQMINDTKPDIVWVGLGAPKQEKWMSDHYKRIQAPVMIGVGAAFDFHSGNIKWAPPILRKCGLEWIHRFVQNPVKMWSRNLNNLRFLGHITAQKLRRPL